MSKTLLIVESPNKIATIKKYLGADYIVKASVGHIRDLPATDMGLDENLNPLYVDTKPDVISSLRNSAKTASQVIVMTDDDREGEAIGWHIVEVLNLGDNYIRCATNDLSKDGIHKALNSPRKINRNFVRAQETRRVLDRLVGFKVSKVTNQLLSLPSAGRVQSPALMLVVERQEQIDKFGKIAYLELELTHPGENGTWVSRLDTKRIIESGIAENYLSPLQYDDENKPKPRHIANAKFMNAIQNEVFRRGHLTVENFSQTVSKTKSHPPFTTALLLKSASSTLNLSITKTMDVAQKLFEKALITYHRTDSTNFEPDSIKLIRDFISKWQESKGSTKYLSPKVNRFKTGDSAQEGHEPIRPTNFNLDINTIHDPIERSLYQLIFCRAIASQMSDAEFYKTEVVLDSGFAIGGIPVKFITTGRVQTFDGWMVVNKELADLEEHNVKTLEQTIPDLFKDQSIQVLNSDVLKRQTKPPSRYTEASLVTELERKGIGRPSTYASIFKTLYSRPYIKTDNRFLSPLQNGKNLIANLKGHFQFLDYGYTVSIENEIDKVEAGHSSYESIIPKINADLDLEIESFKKAVKLNIRFCKCPNCDQESMIQKTSTKKFKYWICTTEKCETSFPDENNSPNYSYKPPEVSDYDCPKCKTQKLTLSKEKPNTSDRWYYCNKKCNFIARAIPDNTQQSNFRLESLHKCPACNKDYLAKRRVNHKELPPIWVCNDSKHCKTFIDDLNDKPDIESFNRKYQRDHTHKCPKCKTGYLQYHSKGKDCWWSCSKKCQCNISDDNGIPNFADYERKEAEKALLMDCPNCETGKLVLCQNKPKFRCSNSSAKGARKCMTFIEMNKAGQPDLEKYLQNNGDNSSHGGLNYHLCPKCKTALSMNKATHLLTCLNGHEYHARSDGSPDIDELKNLQKKPYI
ncbi:type I DNA topoisomerase [Vibrio sp. 10N.261.46.E12]|uniref:type I DNA topoisomerase n=1 Tax=unclassified Vibrio TaxID=2614977 RepID=UPI0009788F7D|nr:MULTISPECIES: type I DNA topoisomerase [unclassified Vibrio]OMO33833.1 DNA topoisomerase I [Vibrio sp. 10N.261.45.E1]PMJ19331.1 DNA topoisomerase I [Vibrio sp. 10N.286.45.B6]PML97978.1 DNA topoisomerase I [Vibrio sp. 10N.261.49.E11]PMM83132.1 DNA topoisomerase I [Vibrio sp. 10N.261.46.E8]PMN59086.1 DNA topoisomerase I [Vibrio sp. 10N.261.45.E11]